MEATRRVPRRWTAPSFLWRWCAVGVVCLTSGSLLLPEELSGNSRRDDPFGFFRPWVVVSNPDLKRLDEGNVVVRTLPGRDGQVVMFGAARLNAPPGRLIAWTRAIAELKRSPFVLAIGRFSDPPAVEDLDGLSLDDRDLDAIRQCSPGNCGLKIGEDEIGLLRRAMDQAGTGRQEAVQREFRRLLLARLNLYRSGGLASVPPYVNGGELVHPQDTFALIMASSPYVSRHLPDLAAHLEGFPQVEHPHAESFFYWSKELYGAGKPVIAVTHVNILRPDDGAAIPNVVVAGKQIFASHYMNGSLGLTMVLRGAAEDEHYLVYLNRSHLDLLGGVFGFLKRSVLEGRLSRDTPKILGALRSRLENGDPKANTSSP